MPRPKAQKTRVNAINAFTDYNHRDILAGMTLIVSRA